MENTTYCGSSAATISCISHGANALLVKDMVRLCRGFYHSAGKSI